MKETCIGPECDRPVRAKHLCNAHYHMQRMGQELRPVRQYNRVQDGMKKCPTCQEVKSVDGFYRRGPNRELPNGSCKPCVIARQKEQQNSSK